MIGTKRVQVARERLSSTGDCRAAPGAYLCNLIEGADRHWLSTVFLNEDGARGPRFLARLHHLVSTENGSQPPLCPSLTSSFSLRVKGVVDRTGGG